MAGEQIFRDTRAPTNKQTELMTDSQRARERQTERRAAGRPADIKTEAEKHGATSLQTDRQTN